MANILKKILDFKAELSTYRMGLLQAKAYRVLKNHTTAVLSEFNISTLDWAFLGALYEIKEGIAFSEMAKVLGVEPPFVTVLAGQLVKKGLVGYTHLESDRRTKILKLTVKGRALVPNIEKKLRAETAKLLKDIGLKDILAYRRVLAGIVDNGHANKISSNEP